MARELEPERGVPSEPPAELIPFIFGVVNRAILVVRTICHLRSERISFAVVLTEDELGTLVKLKRVDIRFYPVRDMAILSPEVSHCATTRFLRRCPLARNCLAPLLV